ncbi:MAG: Trigger factor [Candidatus Nomurabacteria bacterium GW2011_GWA1_43_17]|nr:MAG: Trigger factor [Candidatus Nomurabacteria bacterium GW2011_GWA1_43_17]
MLKVAVKKLPKSEVEIEGELEPEIFESYFAKALKKIGETLKLDGFRKGKVPENVLLSKVPEIRILEEMAELALSEHYPKIIESEKIDAISRPEISITKLARHNPLGFKIKTAMLPQIKLPDYKGIAKKIISGMTDAEKNVAVTDEDLERIHMADVSVDDSTPPKPSPEGRASSPSEKAGDEVKSELPEFNDEFVRALGPFKNVADFRAKLKENIKLEKENQQKEKTRLKIIEKIIDESALEVPEILIGIELDKILYRMESDITQMGLKFEDYLKHLSKTKEDLRKEFRKDAEKKTKLALILNEIAKAEKIVADPEQVAKEVAAILEHYKDADPERARMHAENVLTNEKIFQFLESQ